MSEEFILSSLESVPGYRIKRVLGVVSGSVVRARNLGRDIVATIRSMAGGEIKEYTELMAQTRDEAIRRMIRKAVDLGANAVVGIRFTTSTIAGGAAEVLAYGTAVVLEPLEE